MQNKKFLKSSAILFSGEFLTRLLGFIYISPLYALNPYVGNVNAALMTPYSVILIISAFGIGSAMTQQFSKHLNNKRDYSNTFFDGLYFVLIMGLAMTAIMFIFAPSLIAEQYRSGVEYQHLIYGMYILAFSILFYCLNTLLKSALISQNDLKIVSFTYVSEQIIKIIIVFAGALYFYYFNDSSDIYMIYCFTLSVTLSVISTTLIITYHIIRHKSLAMVSFFHYFFKFKRLFIIVSIGIVYFVNSLFMSGFTFIDNILFGHIIDLPTDQAEELSTIYFNNVFKLINLPIVLGSVFVTIMTRQITITKDSHKFNSFNRILDLQIYYSMFAFTFFVSAGLIFYTIFWAGATEQGVELTAVTSLIIPFYLLRVIFSVYAILLKRSRSVIISVFLLFGFKIVLDLLLVPGIPGEDGFGGLGVYGFTFASIIAIVVSTIYLVLDNLDIFAFKTFDVFNKSIVILKFAVLAITMYLITNVVVDKLAYNSFIEFIIVSAILLIFGFLMFYGEIRLLITSNKKESNA